MSELQPTTVCDGWRDGPIEGERWRDLVLEDPDPTLAVGYQVSNFGRLRSRKRTGGQLCATWRLLEGYVTTWGYRAYNLCGVMTHAHRLVALAFIGPAPGLGMVVRHLDGNPLNNHVDNLAWGTPADNTDDRKRHGRTACGTRNGAARLSEDQVREILRLWREGKLRYEIARHFNVTPESVGHILSGKLWGHVTGFSPGNAEGDRERWQVKAERNHSKLTAKQVLEIVTRGRGGESHLRLARAYGVSTTTIHGILSGKKWRSVTNIVPRAKR